MSARQPSWRRWVVGCGLALVLAPAGTARAGGDMIHAHVTGVADGDVLQVRTHGGQALTVRLVGVDTPDTAGARGWAECGGGRAVAHLRSLAFAAGPRAAGRAVTLRTDPTQRRRDDAGRLRAYVLRDVDHRDLGAAQIAAGWSTAVVEDVPFQKLATYRTRAARAAAARRGVWGLCGADFHRELDGEHLFYGMVARR